MDLADFCPFYAVYCDNSVTALTMLLAQVTELIASPSPSVSWLSCSGRDAKALHARPCFSF